MFKITVVHLKGPPDGGIVVRIAGFRTGILTYACCQVRKERFGR
jgi:hypothetical protein